MSTGAVTTGAVLMLDYQVGLCSEGPHCQAPPLAAEVARRDVLDTAAAMLERARQAGWLVIHVGLGFDPTYELRTNRSVRFARYPQTGAMAIGSVEAGFMPQVTPGAGEPVLYKGCIDPFVGTPLREVLAARGVGRVVLGGVATTLVVESAARHATDSGLDVTVIEDACASFQPDLHDFAVGSTLPLFASVTTLDGFTWS